MKATELLTGQHREVERLFERSATVENADAREDLVEEIARELAAHMVIEQEIFYPACGAVMEDKDPLRQAYEEHGLAASELRKLLAVSGGDPSFAARLRVLEKLVRRHMADEEAELFPEAERLLDEDRLEALGELLVARAAQVRATGYEAALAEGADASEAGLDGRDLRPPTGSRPPSAGPGAPGS